MIALIFYVLLALGVSFLCSVLEAVLLSVTPYYVKALEADSPKAAVRLRRLKESVDRPLAAILSLNTIAHTVGAAGAGAQAAHVFGDAYLGIASGVLTLLILIVSEIIPKTLGARYWRSLAPRLAGLLVALVWLLWPLVKLSELITRMLGKRKGRPRVTRDELEAMVDLGEDQGAIEKGESLIVRNLLRFGGLHATDVMTPRPVIFHLPAAATVGDVVKKCEERGFSRIPVTGGSVDDINGYVLRDDILLQAARDRQGTTLQELQRNILTVPASMPLSRVFDRLLRKTDTLALVVDEYGGTEGLVTAEDVVETLLGLEIVDESDTAVDMQALARAQWEKRARKLRLLESEPDSEEAP
ncbi:MAG: HlyC/CorC family transporter [Deltaproteobacteria bacterium]|jgi:CBS domain containing-hemolysin-like protein|nr:HlyC/CorC family transporter [Deltaproteobacteria bacterium]MBW2537339.1 HlyC/CorC family transporter [Deltaproteobacteria bacterium]